MKQPLLLLILLAGLHLGPPTALAQGTAFTYQGRLSLNGAPAEGLFDLQFELFEAPSGGTSRLDPVTVNGVAASNGLFVAAIDFGLLAGRDYWLGIGVRPAGSADPFTPLSPRQQLTPAPYANFALRAGSYEGPIADSQLSPNVLVAGPGGTIGPLSFVAPTRPVAFPPFSVNTSLLVSNLNADELDGFSASDFWKLGGNADTAPGPHYLGTSDPQPLELRAHSQLGLRVEPNPNTNVANLLAPGTLSFGAQTRQMLNLWGDHYGIGVQDHTLYFRTRPGGFFDGVGGNFAWFAGGRHSDTTFDPGLPPLFSTAAELMRLEGDGQLTVFGSTRNGVQGSSTEGNGVQGTSASGIASGVYGQNQGGGFGVAGRTTGGGSAIFGDNPSTDGWAGNFNGRVNVSGNQHFGAVTRQMLNLFGADYAIGVQNQTVYLRTGNTGSGGFCWFKGGVHSDGLRDPGTGGELLMALNDNGLSVRRGEITWGAGGALTDRQGGSLELGPASGSGHTPHVDFHFGLGSSQDFNVRIINNAHDVLSIFRSGAFSSPMAQFSAGGLTVNGAFVSSSDRHAKAGFAAVDPQAILEKVAALPITRWHYTNDAATPHLGPVAQDFHAAFGVGADDKHIATVDADGVALAAIQGLNRKLEDKEARIRELERTVAELQRVTRELAAGRSVAP